MNSLPISSESESSSIIKCLGEIIRPDSTLDPKHPGTSQLDDVTQSADAESALQNAFQSEGTLSRRTSMNHGAPRCNWRLSSERVSYSRVRVNRRHAYFANLDDLDPVVACSSSTRQLTKP